MALSSRLRQQQPELSTCSAPGQLDFEPQSSSPALPTSGQVLILFRGQAFHTPKEGQEGLPTEGCQDDQEGSQLKATKAFIEMVVRPLEKLDNNVSIVETHGPCTMISSILKLYAPWLISSHEIAAKDQSGNFRQALDYLTHTIGSAKLVAKTYDLVLVTRHDVMFPQAISTWSTDFSRFNLPFPCDVREWTTAGWAFEEIIERNCTHDIFYVMPGRLFPALDNSVMQASCSSALCHSCFPDVPNGHGHGHLCCEEIGSNVAAFDGKVGFAFGEEGRGLNVRIPGSLPYLISK